LRFDQKKKRTLTGFSGDMFRGEWRYNEMRHRWEGNPIQSGDIDDLVAAIKHKIKANDTEVQEQ